MTTYSTNQESHERNRPIPVASDDNSHDDFGVLCARAIRLSFVIVAFASLPGWAHSQQLPAFVTPYLNAHCTPCHGPEKQKGKIRLDTLTADYSKPSNAALWLEVRDQINLGQMPPEDEPRPKIEESQELTQWIAAQLRRTEHDSRHSNGKQRARRLNRREYTFTVSDLLQMKFPTGESPLDSLPPDGTAEGFDTVGTALLLDPSLLHLYYQIGRRIADRAIVDGPPEHPTETMRLEFEDIPDSNAIGYLVSRLGLNPVEGGLELIEGDTRSYGMLRYPGRRDNNVAPVNGFYRFTVRAGGVPDVHGNFPRMRLTHDHPNAEMEIVMEINVEAPWNEPKEYTVVIPRDTLGGELHVSLINETRLYMSQRPGEHFMQRNRELGEQGNFAETIRLAGRKVAEGWGGDRSTPDPEKLDTSGFPRLFLDYLEVEGPLYEQWPPRSHQLLLGPANDQSEQTEKARRIFESFLPLAWRRPIEQIELTPILQLVSSELAQGASFHEAIRLGLTASLTSPKFLYLGELESTASSGITDDFALASRLSYFLWSSLPDEKLFALAAENRLHNPTILQSEVIRMLKHPKIDRFVNGFARQWLKTDTFLDFAPDPRLYRSFDDPLAKAAVQEPIAFFREILTHDLSVLNFLDSPFAVVNQRLAQHYGFSDVEAEGFQRIPLPPDSPRRGLLGMIGIHLAGSDGIRTKPVHRAVYVREVLFNDPPDPPPPNAGEVEPNIEGKNLTVRERLQQHQAIETCAACHRNLDPYGLALENFNVIGQWRDQQDGENFRGRQRPIIDPSGTLPNGESFQTFEEFRSLLHNQADRFRRGLAEKLWIYALGRAPRPSDDHSLQTVVQDLQQNGDTLQAAIQGIVTSPQFLNH